MQEKLTRRDFVKLSAMASVGAIPLFNLANPLFDSHGSGENKLKIYLFSKHLQFLDYQGMSEAAKEMGFDGLDLTVRPKGHVLPERVAEDLPRATEAMRSVGLRTDLFTSKVLDAKNITDQKVLRVASKLGYEYYRIGWYRYKGDDDVLERLATARKLLQGIAKLNKQLGIAGSYHNHSGNYVGAPIWDLDQALEGISPKHLGAQYDIMHGTVESGANWEVNFRLIKDHINTLVVKDFLWKREKGVWKRTHIPMGAGMVNFNRYFSLLKQYKINVPVSMHVEHDLGGAEKGGKPSIPHHEVFARIKKDLDFVKRMWDEA